VRRLSGVDKWIRRVVVWRMEMMKWMSWVGREGMVEAGRGGERERLAERSMDK